MSKTMRTLREIETNRVVKAWEEEDRGIFESLLAEGTKPERAEGIVPGERCGEMGWVYASPLPPDSDS